MDPNNQAITPDQPSVASSPSSQNLNPQPISPTIINPQNPSSYPPVQTQSPENPTKKLPIAMGIIVFLITLGMLGFILYKTYSKNTTIFSSTSNNASTNANYSQIGNNPSPISTIQIPKTSTFKLTGIQFSYDNSWKEIGGNELINSFWDPVHPNIPNSQYLFYSSTNWQQVNKDTADLKTKYSNKNNLNIGTGFSIMFDMSKLVEKADFALTQIPSIDAKTATQQLAQSSCAGSSSSFSTSNPIDNSRIQTVKINSYNAYLVLPQSGCSYKSVQALLESKINSPTPTSDPGVIVINPISLKNIFILSFTNTSDLQHLSQSQQIILNSIQLP